MDDHNPRMVSEHISSIKALEKAVSDFKEWKAGIMVEHETLKAGVANFRVFQGEAREFFIRADDRAKEHEKRMKTQWKVGVVILGLLATPATWLGSRSVKFFEDLYQITEEWHQIHHSEIQPKKSSLWPEPVLSYTKPAPQVSTIPKE